MKCAQCGTENADSAKFCKACGSRMQADYQAPQANAFDAGAGGGVISKGALSGLFSGKRKWFWVAGVAVVLVICIIAAQGPSLDTAEGLRSAVRRGEQYKDWKAAEWMRASDAQRTDAACWAAMAVQEATGGGIPQFDNPDYRYWFLGEATDMYNNLNRCFYEGSPLTVEMIMSAWTIEW